MLVIRELTKAKKVINFESLPLSQRIFASTSQFEQVDFLHMYRHLNPMANKLAKKGDTMSQGVIDLDHKLRFSPTP